MIALSEEKFFNSRSSCAMSIQVEMSRARSWGFSRGSISMLEMTRNETALNCVTVASTELHSCLSRFDQIAPRHWCGMSRLNSSMSMRVSCSAKCFTGMLGKRYELSRWDGGPRNAGRFGLQEGRLGVQLLIPVEQQLEHLLRLREGAEGVQEHVHERALELAVVGREGIDQPGQGGRLDEPHAHRLPFQYVGTQTLILNEDVAVAPSALIRPL
uniref:Uncharacterized protein n=1 Tax=Anopheles merus TaxID=30066 RepID=A0A182V017_ANOME